MDSMSPPVVLTTGSPAARYSPALVGDMAQTASLCLMKLIAMSAVRASRIGTSAGVALIIEYDWLS